MTQHPPILLRYFNARGRAQFLRGYFLARGIEFEDERVPLDEGFVSRTSMRDDRALTGPLKRLPVLLYGDQLIPETVVPDTYAGNSLERIGRTLDVLDQTLADWGWVSTMDERPETVADCFLWEELDQARTVFGSPLMFDDRSQLARFHAENRARETFEQALEKQPAQITARPDKAAAIDRIRACLSK